MCEVGCKSPHNSARRRVDRADVDRHVRKRLRDAQPATDRRRKPKDCVSEHIGRESQHGVAVEVRVLEVDAGGAVLSHNDLQRLVVPAVDAGAHLLAVRVEPADAVQDVGALLGQRVRHDVVQAHDEQRRVHQLQALAVALVNGFQALPSPRPHVAVLGRQQADSGQGAVRTQAGRVGPNGSEVLRYAFLRHGEAAVGSEHVEPVDLATAHDDEVGAFRRHHDFVAPETRHARRAKQVGVLAHVQWALLERVGLQNSAARGGTVLGEDSRIGL